MEMYANPVVLIISILENVCADVSSSHLEIFGMMLRRKLIPAKSVLVSLSGLADFEFN
jgi:hypothetical protein